MFSIDILAQNFRSGEGMGPSHVALSATGGRYLGFGHRIDQMSLFEVRFTSFVAFSRLIQSGSVHHE